MKTRAKSALIMAPLLIIVFLGGYFLIAGVFVLSLLAIREYCAAFGEKKPVAWVMYTSLCILYGGYLLQLFTASSFMTIDAFNQKMSDTGLLMMQQGSWFILFWVFISLILCFLSMFSMEKRDLLHGMATITGVLYINFLAFHIILVDCSFSDPITVGWVSLSGLNSFVWIIIMASFGTDIFAYLTGKVFGKRKLCPTISPKKTIEGSIGGVLGSILLCGLFGYFFIPGGLAACIIIGFAGGIVSQLGDLSASVMKRKIGIKDWGEMIPGHGGVLDRIDSILFTSPLVYYFLFIKEGLFFL